MHDWDVHLKSLQWLFHFGIPPSLLHLGEGHLDPCRTKLAAVQILLQEKYHKTGLFPGSQVTKGLLNVGRS